MRRSLGALMLAAALLAGCASEPGAQAPSAQAAASTPTPTAVPTPTPTAVPTPTPTAVPTPTPTAVPTPEITPKPTPKPTPVPQRGFPAGFVSASEALGHVGRVVTVCGTVASANYATSTNGSPTFLNLDEPYPNSAFAILIWPEYRASFGGAPEERFAGARVCIKGLVSSYGGIAQIESTGGDIKVYD